MPESMIRDDSGDRLKVIGSSMAMVGIGPMPGSTPISVPSITPMKQMPMLVHVAAAAKPIIRLLKTSIMGSLRPPAERQRLRQRQHENDGREHGKSDAEEQRFLPARLGPRISAHHRDPDGGDDQAERFQQPAEENHR